MFTLLVRVLGVNHRRHAAVLLTGVVGIVIGGAAVFADTQHRPFTTGVYWAITTATTVGYGDVTPRNASGRFVASTVMLTAIPMLAAVFALMTGAAVASRIRRILSMRVGFPTGSYRLVVGMHRTVPAILDELVRAQDAVVLVADVDPDTVREEVHVVRGDPTQPTVIRRAHPEGAQHALITAESDGDVLVSAVLLRRQAPNLPLAALVSSASVREALGDLGVQQVISAEDLIAHTLAKVLEAPHAGDLVALLVDSARQRLVEVEADQATTGRRLSSVRDERAGLVLGLVHDGTFSLGIGDDPVVAAGDHLLIAEPDAGKRAVPRPDHRAATVEG
jgi:voltage-gated potassium channel